MARVALGEDPQGDKKETARRKPLTFEALAERYVEEHAKKTNRSWKQAHYLVRKHVLPRWRGKSITTISRADVKEIMRGIKAPVVANQALAAASAIFSWAIKEEIGGVKENPCKLVARNEVKSRERVLSDRELPRFWSAFDDAGLIAGTALKLILLTGQRPGEVTHMRHEHLKDGWWEMPGAPDPASKWPGTKNGASHRVWLSEPVQELLTALEDDRDTGFVFGVSRLDTAMRDICIKLGVKNKVTPHDLRRTNGTMITRLGFGRDAMNRVQNHKEGGIASVYDRHEYCRREQAHHGSSRSTRHATRDGQGCRRQGRPVRAGGNVMNMERPSQPSQRSHSSFFHTAAKKGTLKIKKTEIARHEAGHAVIAHVLNFPVRGVTIVPDDKSLGRMIWNKPPVWFRDVNMVPLSPAKRQHVEDRIIVMLAGPLAMRRHNPRSHWKKSGTGYGKFMSKGTDFQVAGVLIEALHGDETVASAYSRYVRARAEALVEQNWEWIESVARHLLEHETFGGNIGELNPELVDIRKRHPDGVPMTVIRQGR